MFRKDNVEIFPFWGFFFWGCHNSGLSDEAEFSAENAQRGETDAEKLRHAEIEKSAEEGILEEEQGMEACAAGGQSSEESCP